MKINKVSKHFAVAPQIATIDLAAIKQAGYQTIICNRPDNEQPEQPNYADIAAAAEKQAISCHFIPIDNKGIDREQITTLTNIIATDNKVLAYCRSGTRSITLWALAQLQQGELPSTILEKTAAAGYNLNHLFV